MNDTREELQIQRKHFLDMILILRRDIGESDGLIFEQKLSHLDQAEEEFAFVRLHLTKLKSEIRTLSNVRVFC